MNAEAISTSYPNPTSGGLSTTTAANPLIRFLAWLVRPSAALTDEALRGRSQLLGGMMLATQTVGILMLAWLTARSQGSNLVDPDFWMTVIGIGIVFFAISLNRRGQVKVAARIFITVLSVIFIAVPFIAGGIPELASFAIIPILLTAIFFSVRATAFLSVFMVVALSVMSGLTLGGKLFVAPFFVLLFGILIVLFIRQFKYEEGIRSFALRHANEKLRESEESLERRVAERTEQLERANRVKSAFLASMSHELRTPLNAIINFTKFVAKGSMGPINDEQQGALNEVIDSAKHLLSLINDVLDMSKIESGSLKLFVEKVDLNGIVKSLLSTGKTLIGEKPIELRAEVDTDLPSIVGDKQRIYQVLLNILSNACKFTEEGRITVSAHRINDNVEFSIKDSGPGIAQEDHELVFKAFQQTNTGLRQAGGTGLGMPISRSLAEAHGGRLWLESEPGKGATFYVSLPIQSTILQPTVFA